MIKATLSTLLGEVFSPVLKVWNLMKRNITATVFVTWFGLGTIFLIGIISTHGWPHFFTEALLPYTLGLLPAFVVYILLHSSVECDTVEEDNSTEM